MRWFSCCLIMCVAWCIAGADFGSPKRNAREPEIFTETEIRENMPSAPWYFVPPVTDRNFWKKYGGDPPNLQRNHETGIRTSEKNARRADSGRIYEILYG